MHCDLGFAKLRLKGRYGDEEIDAAGKELIARGYLRRCHMHSGCFRLVKGE